MSQENKRILSGMRSSTSQLHIGNYEGALRNWVDLQNEGYDMFCMIADYHSLTTMFDSPAEASKNAREIAKDYIASGIDPEKSCVFVQSHVPAHAELHLLFSMITPLGWLERTPTYKEKVEDMVHEASQRVTELLGELLKACEDTKGETDFLTPIIGIKSVIGTVKKDDPQSYFTGCQTILTIWKDSSVELKQSQKEISKILKKLEKTLSQLAISVPYGLLGYPVLQTADILLYRPLGVPVGRDQAPHLEIGNDIGRRFNSLYNTELFQPYKYMIPQDENKAKLPGLDMRKMSKSYNNGINISDSPEETAKKIKSAYTTPSKIQMTDPGIPEGCAVCQYLKIYSPDWEKQWQEDIDGKRGCSQNKNELTEIINEYFRPIREKRTQLDDATIEKILKEGAEHASDVANETMRLVRDAMGMY